MLLATPSAAAYLFFFCPLFPVEPVAEIARILAGLRAYFVTQGRQHERKVQTSKALIDMAMIRLLVARQERRAAANQGANRFQWPSETTSTTPSITLRAV